MKTVLFNKQGGVDVLEYTEVTDPEIKKDTEVKIRIHAAGVNPIDTKVRGGAYPLEDLPLIPGCDGAGEVIETGSAVKNVSIGEQVYFFHGGISGINGNYAEYAVIEEHFLVRKPASLTYNQAAAAPLVLITAWEALFDRASLKAGDKVFINAGAGGVGHVAIQLANYVGAQVCTTISSDEKAAFVKKLGADCIINYKNEDVEARVLEWTNGSGVDVALDNVGGKETEKLFPLTKVYGQIVSLLLPVTDLNWLSARVRNQTVSFEVMTTPQLLGMNDAQKHQSWILEQCASLLNDNNLTIEVRQELPLSDAAKAHQLIEQGDTIGKIILVTSDP